MLWSGGQPLMVSLNQIATKFFWYSHFLQTYFGKVLFSVTKKKDLTTAACSTSRMKVHAGLINRLVSMGKIHSSVIQSSSISHWWPWSLSSDWEDELMNTSGWNEFPSGGRLGSVSERGWGAGTSGRVLRVELLLLLVERSQRRWHLIRMVFLACPTVSTQNLLEEVGYLDRECLRIPEEEF